MGGGGGGREEGGQAQEMHIVWGRDSNVQNTHDRSIMDGSTCKYRFRHSMQWQGSLGSKEPPFCSLNNRKMGVVWLKVGAHVPGKIDEKNPPL